MAQQKTYSQKPADIAREWFIVDASETPLGRLATQVASLLVGKNKPQFTPHIDGGDYVVIINANKLVVTGNKLLDKSYYRHSGHPGGIREISLQEQVSKDATKVVRDAIFGMIPSNKLRSGRMQRLKIYPGAEHSHEAQKPKSFSISKGGNA